MSSTTAIAVVPPVFDGMPERSEYATILEENTVNIEDALLGDYGYNDMDGGVHGGGEEEEEEEELQEIGGEVLEASQSTTGYNKRKKGYTQLEDEVLTRAWEAVSLDAIHGTDQNGMLKTILFAICPFLATAEQTPYCRIAKQNSVLQFGNAVSFLLQ
ncbi:hypothetical protein ZWY2020_055931 [Hordeum vulgare]|nr:hypothetical protein ZWY2020_055931 [Hordeum vulgare]